MYFGVWAVPCPNILLLFTLSCPMCVGMLLPGVAVSQSSPRLSPEAEPRDEGFMLLYP